MDSKGFRDLENFDLAYKARLNEFMKIKNIDDAPKILMMHLGGIIIEIYVKSIIVKSKNIAKERKKLWYTMDKYDFIMSKGNMKNPEYPSYSELSNPGHKIKNGIRAIDELSELLTNNSGIEECIENITYPLGQLCGKEFIDLRYISPCSVQNLDDLFETWNNSFEKLLKWSIKNSKEVEVR